MTFDLDPGLLLNDASIVRNQDAIFQCVARAIRNTEATLFLGAGASKSLGFPLWRKLVELMAQNIGDDRLQDIKRLDTFDIVDYIKSSLKISASGAADRDYTELVRKSLYEEAFGAECYVNNQYPDELIYSSLMTALGAIIMSTNGGRVKDVVSLNFDDSLETYLNFYGISSNPVVSYPARIPGNSDVTIYHPHGFLPLRIGEYDQSSSIIFSSGDFMSTKTKEYASWRGLLSNLFISKFVIFIGYSFSDPHVVELIENTFTLLRKNQSSAFLGVTFILRSNYTDELIEKYSKMGILIMVLDDFNDLPSRLLKLVRAAR